MMKTPAIAFFLFGILLFSVCDAFVIMQGRKSPLFFDKLKVIYSSTSNIRSDRRVHCLFASSTDSTTSSSSSPSSSSSSSEDEQDVIIPVASMRVKEIQAELKERNISYDDCFDKESLVQRLIDAREGIVKGTEKSTTTTDNETKDTIKTSPSPSSSSSSSTSTKATAKRVDFDRDEKLQELRSMKVKELREECGKRRIRWSKFVEKEDYIQALLTAMESSAQFSVSGEMIPGQVTDLTAEQLEQELSQPSDAPLLLDIYALWCGPCKMMAPQLELAAAELADKVRVGKIDSDKYPAISQRLKAAGLPTVLILNGDEELQRIEGAMMKDQIMKFVEPCL